MNEIHHDKGNDMSILHTKADEDSPRDTIRMEDRNDLLEESSAIASENNVHRVMYEGKELIIIGTAHVSKNSAEEVRSLIQKERPSTVCIELDQGRYESLMNKDAFRNMDITKIIKEKKTAIVLVNVLLGSYQKRLAKQMDIQAGQEMMVAIEEANALGARLVMADRNIQTTFVRVWRNHNFFEKFKLLLGIIEAAFSDESISEDDLERLKQSDVLSMALQEIGDKFPKFAQSLIFERDAFLANKIKHAPGSKIVAVCGAAHVPGILVEIHKQQDMIELNRVPEPGKFSKVMGWVIPGCIVLLIVASFFMDQQVGFQQMKSWILWTGTMSALGTAVALGHPLSIITAFAVAPISALHPLIAAGWFAGLVEAYIRKPRVSDFENLSDDVESLRGFFKNRVIHIIMVVILANLFTSIGSFISGLDIFQSFLKMFQ